jgi:hypothetical protein
MANKKKVIYLFIMLKYVHLSFLLLLVFIFHLILFIIKILKYGK